MAPTHSPRSARLPRLRALAALAAVLLAAACSTTRSIDVHSTPAGARVLIDGADSGQKTPTSVVLSTATKKHVITLEKAGYNPVAREVELTKDVDVIDADEAVGSICLAPCCCGLPLLRLLRPVDVETRFAPSRIDATLEVAGQGARLEVTPTPFEVWVDGKLVNVLDGCYVVTTPGDHELEVRAAGHRSYARTIHVDDRLYQRLKIELEVEGEGLLVHGSPEGAKVYLDEQYQGKLGDDKVRVRAAPGAHMLRVELEGWHTWQDIVEVVGERYEAVTVDLKLEGQGLRVRRPEGLPARPPEVQVLVDGTLQGSAFDTPIRLEPGEYAVEIRVTGRETRNLRVRIAKDGWLELEPGPKTDGKRGAQRVLERTGFRVVTPRGLHGLERGDVKVTSTRSGAVLGHGFDEIVEMPLDEGDASEDVSIMIAVRGHLPWTGTIRITRGQVLDVYPELVEE